MKKRFSPRELKPLLQALSQTQGVIIGGQAVNLWAEQFQKESSPWIELRPYTSFDLDVLGNRSDVLICGRALDAEVFFPTPTENTVNSGKIVAQFQNTEFEIDFLHSPTGLSSAEAVELARPIFFEEIEIKVLHPLHCLESKTVSLMTLPQDAGGRQDLKHLRLSIAILREYLIKMTVEGGVEALLLRWARRIRANSNHELGIQAAIKYGINFQDAVPAELWQSRPGALAGFVKQEWDDWREEVSEKIFDLKELEIWLKGLNRPTS